MHVAVCIIGAGPADLLLCQLLHRAGVASRVLERRSCDYIERRVRAGLLIDRSAKRRGRPLALLARTHRHTVMSGRTWLQHALPVSFGLKAARWLSGIQAARHGFAASAKCGRTT